MRLLSRYSPQCLQRQLRSELGGISFFEAAGSDAFQILSCTSQALLRRTQRAWNQPNSSRNMDWAVVWTASSMVDSEQHQVAALPRGLHVEQLRQLVASEKAFLLGLPVGRMAPRGKVLRAELSSRGAVLTESSAAQPMAQDGQPPFVPPDVDFDFYRQVQEEEKRRFLGRPSCPRSSSQQKGDTSFRELLFRAAAFLQVPEAVGVVAHDTPALDKGAPSADFKRTAPTRLGGLSLTAQFGCHHAAIIFSASGLPAPKCLRTLQFQATRQRVEFDQPRKICSGAIICSRVSPSA